MKFGRTYSMVVEVSDDEAVQMAYPLTLSFDIVRNTLASANRGHFAIRNLRPDTRRRLFHDRNQTLDYRRIVLRAGYEDQSPLPEIFAGNLVSAYSYRQGTDWVTEIEAFDGGFGILNGQTAQTIPAGWNLRQTILSVLSTMRSVVPGAIGDVDTDSSRGVTLMGNSWDVLGNLTASHNATPFIDGEVANVLKDDEVIGSAPALTRISPATGILETPRRSNELLEVSMVFEPRLRVGQEITLETQEAVYNGNYKILGITHRGTISGAVCGDCVTTVSLNLGAFVLKPVGSAS